MKKILFLWSIVVILFSCKGQNRVNHNNEENSKNAIGKRIFELTKKAPIIFHDSKNNYWFGGDGVIRFDGKEFIQFTTKDGLYSNGIRGIQEDSLGNIYFDTEKGINKFNGKTIEKIEFNYTSDAKWKLEANDLWFMGDWNKNGVYRYDGKELYHLKLPQHILEEEFYTNNPNVTYSPYSVYTITKDSKGNIWIGTGTFGACFFDGQKITWISEREMTEMDSGPSMGVRSILEDHEGNFWFNSNMNHKYKLLPNNGLSQRGALTYQKLEGIDTAQEEDLENYFMSIVQGNDGDIWMTRYEGEVWRYNGKELISYSIKHHNIKALIFSIYKDNQGVIWLGTHNLGALKFSGTRFEPFRLNH